MSERSIWDEATDGDVDEVTRMLDEEGVDVDSMDEVSVCALLAHLGAVWDSMETPLFDASWNGHLDVFQVLLDRGANPLIKDRVSRVCFYWL